jgi:hypothetical protein
MKKTQNLEMNIPEGGDPINITDITDNFETLDTEIAKKANSSGGDISNTTVKTVDTIAVDFPVPSAGESSKTFLGKVRKFIQDFITMKDTLLTLSKLVNNGQTTASGFALDARYGKTLYDLYAQLNTDFDNLDIRVKGTVSYQGGSSNANDFEAFMTLGSGSNYPDSGLWYIMTLIYNTQNKKQLAFGYRNNNIKTRYCDSGTWSNWV